MCEVFTARFLAKVKHLIDSYKGEDKEKPMNRNSNVRKKQQFKNILSFSPFFMCKATVTYNRWTCQLEHPIVMRHKFRGNIIFTGKWSRRFQFILRHNHIFGAKNSISGRWKDGGNLDGRSLIFASGPQSSEAAS